jgi:hypothetical protein
MRFCVPLVCLTLWAQKELEYRAGRLLKISNQSDLNRRYASPLGPGWQFDRAFHAPPHLSAAVAELER